MGNGALQPVGDHSLRLGIERGSEGQGIYVSHLSAIEAYRDRCVLLFSELLSAGYFVNKSPTAAQMAEMPPDTRIEEAVVQVKNCNIFVFFVSLSTVSSDFQCLELACAITMKKKIVFVVLQPSASVEGLSKILNIDLSSLGKVLEAFTIMSIYEIREEVAAVAGDGDKMVTDRNAQPQHQFSSGDKYWGKVTGPAKCIKTGYGRCVYALPAGREYIGDFKDGKRHGSCVVRYPTGYLFVGDYVEEKWHGHGIMIYSDGDIYEGDYAKGVREGTGFVRYHTGDTYRGKFVNDFFHGYGRYDWGDDKAYYEGEFVNGQRHGFGTIYEADGSVTYQGQFVDGEEVEKS